MTSGETEKEEILFINIQYALADLPGAQSTAPGDPPGPYANVFTYKKFNVHHASAHSAAAEHLYFDLLKAWYCKI